MLVALSLVAFVGCFAEGGRVPGPGNGGRSGSGGTGNGQAGLGVIPPDPTGGEGGEIEPPPSFTCDDAEGEPLPARRAITSPDSGGGDDGGQTTLIITKAQLHREFERQDCGTSECHGGENKPLLQSPDTFKMTLESFDDRPTLGTEALERILSSDPDRVMPPTTAGGDGSKRGPDNPVRILGERLLAWQEAGFPDAFEVSVNGEPIDPSLPEDPYLLSPQLGQKLTNIGSCVPRQATVPSGTQQEMEQKDALFATIGSSNDLPDTLFETDLVSLESATLARRNVFSYAPTYTLFSDNAGKMRHVRVPLGETISYDAENKDFRHPRQHALLQDVPQEGHRRRRQRRLAQDGNAPHRRPKRRSALGREVSRSRASRRLRLGPRREDGQAREGSVPQRGARRGSPLRVHRGRDHDARSGSKIRSARM